MVNSERYRLDQIYLLFTMVTRCLFKHCQAAVLAKLVPKYGCDNQGKIATTEELSKKPTAL